MTSLLPVVVAFVVALVMTPVLRWLGHRHDLLDHPNDRSMHARPTPRDGGIAIILGLVATLLLFGEWQDLRLLFVLGWAAVIAAMGLIDDLRSLSARVRLAVQFVMAVATVFAADVTLRYVELPGIGELHFPRLLGVCVTLFWIVGLTNAYNFMDGINGIASMQAIVCGSAFAVLFRMQGDAAGLVLSLGLAGGAAGFLMFNAAGSIFMGDVGSSTLGFLFAVLALRLAYWDVPFLAALLPLLPFLFDTGITLVKRAVRGERFFAAHRTHYYQRLTDLGWSHLAVASTYALFAIACSVVAIRWREHSRAELVAAVLGLVATLTACALLIDWRTRRNQRATI